MVRITKRGIDQKLKEALLNTLLEEIKKCKTSDDLSAVLKFLLTPEEQIMFEKRLAITLFIKSGKRIKDITQTLDVSRSTIGFVKRGLKNPPPKPVKPVGKITTEDLRQKTRRRRPSRHNDLTAEGRWRFKYRSILNR